MDYSVGGNLAFAIIMSLTVLLLDEGNFMESNGKSVVTGCKMIVCNNVTRYFLSNDNKKQLVLDGLDLNIKKGEIYGLVGKNGAGKTTLIKILSNLLYPNSGEVYINGYDVLKESLKAKKNMGVVLSNNRALYLKLTAYENLLFFARLYGVKKCDIKSQIDYVLSLVDLTAKKSEYVENFSHGMMQRLNIARALLAEPELLIFDEPTNGLDIESTNQLRNVIVNLNSQGKTILFTTHNLQEVDLLATTMGILKDGKITKQGKPQNLIANFKGKIYELVLDDAYDTAVISLVEKILGTKVKVAKSKLVNSLALKFVNDNNVDIAMLHSKLHDSDILVKTISNVELDLNDVFMFE